MQRLLATGENPFDLDDEWLLNNAPDVVLTQDTCYFCEVDADRVRGAVGGMDHPPRVVVLQPKTMAEIFDSIRQVGDACGASGAAASLVDSLQQRVECVAQGLKGIQDRPRVFSLEGINPIVTGGHWIPDLLQASGGRQEMFSPGSRPLPLK